MHTAVAPAGGGRSAGRCVTEAVCAEAPAPHRVQVEIATISSILADTAGIEAEMAQTKSTKPLLRAA